MLRIALISFIFTSLLLNWLPVQWQSLGNFNIIASICCVLIIIFYRRKWCLFIVTSWLATITFVFAPIQSQSQLLNSVNKATRVFKCSVHIVSPQQRSLFSSIEVLAKINSCEINRLNDTGASKNSRTNSRSIHSRTDNSSEVLPLFDGQLIRLFAAEKWSGDIHFNHVYQVLIKVKPIRQKKNFGQFDFEKYAFSSQLIWTANLKQKPIKLSYTPRSNVLEMKDLFKKSLGNISVDSQNLGLFRAMLLGDKSELSEDVKAIVARSGLMHLLVISGLHLGLFAGYGVLMAFLLTWIFPKLCNIIARKDTQALFAVIFASLYWVVLPDSEPVFRAWLTLIIWSILHVSRFKILLFDKLLISCSGVILIDPFASLSMGFHLTMAALGAICILSHLSQKFKLSKLGIALTFQIGVSILMIPFLIANQMPVSILSPLINLVAVPLFSLLIMPGVVLLTLLSHASMGWSVVGLNFILSLTNELILAAKWVTLEFWLIQAKHLSIVGLLITFILLIAYLISCVFCGKTSLELWCKHKLNKSFGRLNQSILFVANGNVSERLNDNWNKSFVYCSAIAAFALLVVLLVVLVNARLGIEPEKASVITLDFHDVGQGTAVSWHDGHVVNYFDTGPSWNGQSVLNSQIIPSHQFMRGGALFVSHNDNDHAGAIDSLYQSFHFDSVHSGEPLNNRARSKQQLAANSPKKELREAMHTEAQDMLCRQGQIVKQRYWTAEVLYPNRANLQGNSASCTVHLTFNTEPELKVLLNGDINQADELLIIQRLIDLGGVDILMLSHHGSRFSNSKALLNAASAAFVISTTGFWNHYGHPAKQTIARLTQGVTLLDTAKNGAIRFVLNNGKWSLKTSRERKFIWQYIEN